MPAAPVDRPAVGHPDDRDTTAADPRPAELTEPTLASPDRPDATASAAAERPLATYEDLAYRDVFWATRAYEDGCDRVALRALLPARGRRLLEVGAGFGRLVGEYAGYDEVVLVDPSDLHVSAARDAHLGSARIDVRLGRAEALPLDDASVDTVVCVRVLHHIEDPRPALLEMHRVLRPGGTLVLEFANKRNLKAIARYLARRQSSSPLVPGPHRYRAFHVDHAPSDVRRWLRSAGFAVESTRSASLFRLPILSRHVPAHMLVGLERPLQRLLGELTPGPSVYVRAVRRP